MTKDLAINVYGSKAIEGAAGKKKYLNTEQFID